jgi:hypothetical protein
VACFGDCLVLFEKVLWCFEKDVMGTGVNPWNPQNAYLVY